MTFVRCVLLAGLGLLLLGGTGANAAAKRPGARLSIATFKQSARPATRPPLHKTSHRMDHRLANRGLMTGH